jgi:WD40 repeat protein
MTSNNVSNSILNSSKQPELFCIQMLSRAHSDEINCICLDRMGKYILTGSSDRSVKIFSAFDGRFMATFQNAHDAFGIVNLMHINYENTLLAIVDDSSYIRIWNLDRQQFHLELKNSNKMHAIEVKNA